MPAPLYHGSSRLIEGPLEPVLVAGTEDHTHERASVFGTELRSVAALFMFPMEALASIGFEEGVAYICIWGTPEEYASKDAPGYLYVLPADTFEKVGKGYEWQSFSPATPQEIVTYPSALESLITEGVQVYFVNDDATFDRIVADKERRMPVLRTLVSENERAASVRSSRPRRRTGDSLPPPPRHRCA